MPIASAAIAGRLTAVAAACVLIGLSAARAADAHPDFTGVWTSYREPGAPPPVFRPGAGPELPLKPEAKAKVEAFRKLIGTDSAGAHCLGAGMPGQMLSSGGYPMEIVQRPEELVVIYEAEQELRHIYLGDRIMPEPDRFPDRDGFSSAHWEGDTLVVDIDSLKEQVDSRYSHSDQARITERYHLETDAKGAKVLVNDMTMTDPGFYTEPVKVTKKWTLVPNGHLLPYNCNEEGWEEHVEDLQAGRAAPAKY